MRQPHPHPLVRGALLVLVLLPLTAVAAPADGNPRGEVQVLYPENYCFGGIEDRKIIVAEGRLENPFRQTTRLGCQVDGGDPQTMPDLPAPTPEVLRLA